MSGWIDRQDVAVRSLSKPRGSPSRTANDEVRWSRHRISDIGTEVLLVDSGCAHGSILSVRVRGEQDVARLWAVPSEEGDNSATPRPRPERQCVVVARSLSLQD